MRLSEYGSLPVLKIMGTISLGIGIAAALGEGSWFPLVFCGTVTALLWSVCFAVAWVVDRVIQPLIAER